MEKAMLIDTPLGRMLAVADDKSLRSLDFVDEVPEGLSFAGTPLLERCKKEIQAYFAGDLQKFTVPVDPKGTPFQQRVWQALLAIPYGETRSYKEIAVAIGQPKATRAIGGANHNNPISLIIPCHRVIGANGQLTGYGGGLHRKEALLALEKEHR